MFKKILHTLTFMLLDVLILVAVFYLSIYIRVNISTEPLLAFTNIPLSNFYFVIIVIVGLFTYEKLYALRYDFWQETLKILRALFFAYFIVLAMLTLQKTSLEYSRLFITLYFAFAVALLPIVKRYTKKLLYKCSFFRKKVLVVGDEEQKKIFTQEFDNNWYLGMEVVEEGEDSVIISSKGMDLDTINTKIDKHLHAKSSVYVVPYVMSINFANSNIMEYSNIRFNSIQIENKLLIKRNIFLKNIFDIFATLILLPIFLLAHIVISLAIKLDSKGSIFFKQHRLGKDDKDFVCYKYRTMYEDTDALLQEYLVENPDEIEYYKKYHKYKNDPRITKIGKILRSTSLDELAQLINILKGEMSLVGPRPYMLQESCKLGDAQGFILKVNPGITGLWQVSGRNELTFKERNELEVWYIKNWSLWADFVILVKTVKVVLGKVGAK